jgi:glucose-1-phosphate cytidylyltransferase
MKVAILAGGYGTRLSEETELKPKPMVEIGGRPILWHIMKHYYSYGFDDFVILCGYKSSMIKEYFVNYALHHCDVQVDAAEHKVMFSNNQSEKWRITLLETGLDTMTGGRLLRAKEHLKDSTFMLTYGDGVSDVNIKALVDFHNSNKGVCTLTAVQPEGRFGVLQMTETSQITHFAEKPKGEGTWINGGFLVCEPEIFDYLKNGDQTVLERDPLEELAAARKLFACKHHGFWKCMDTLRDKIQLQQMWDRGEAPWRA